MPLHERTANASVAEQTVTCLLDRARGKRACDVRIGLGYTAVRLADGGTGVAFTFRDEAKGGCSVFRRIQRLSTCVAADLLVLLRSQDAIEAGVGLACANALAHDDEAAFLDGDILDHLDLQAEDCVGMVGHFGPLVGPIQQRARSLTVFEQVPRPSGLMRPQHEAEESLPGCQVALITGTSIINHTIDNLLAAARHCREVVVLGASTPLLPRVFAGRGVTMLSGVVVKEPDEVLRVVSEGRGMQAFSPYVRKVVVRMDTARPS